VFDLNKVPMPPIMIDELVAPVESTRYVVAKFGNPSRISAGRTLKSVEDLGYWWWNYAKGPNVRFDRQSGVDNFRCVKRTNKKRKRGPPLPRKKKRKLNNVSDFKVLNRKVKSFMGRMY